MFNGDKVSMPVDVQGVHAQVCVGVGTDERTFLDLCIQTRNDSGRRLKLRCDSG